MKWYKTKVLTGFQDGRTIGFPTINLDPLILPIQLKEGVYKADVKYKDEVYVKTRKYSCKRLLRRKIMNDPECQQFLNYDGNRNHQRLD